MRSLLLKFLIDFDRYEYPDHCQPHGPKFHRWLPDGEKDALVIGIGHPKYELKVWFQRWGVVNDKFIKFAHKNEIDPEIIPKQGILDGGPLIGQMKIEIIAEDVVEILRESKIGSEKYKSLAKQYLDIMTPHLNRLIGTLRTKYGQYWIPAFRSWDSRECNLGNYCKDYLNLKWSIDDGQSWSPFIPEEPSHVINIVSPLPSKIFMRRYITQEDWNELNVIINQKYEPSPAAYLLVEAYEAYDNEKMKEALIYGHSAVEAAVSILIKTKLEGSPFLPAVKNAILTGKIIILAKLFTDISVDILEQTTYAISQRNAIIHAGKNIDDDAKNRNAIFALLQVTAFLVHGPKFKFPSLHHGNALMGSDKWEQE